MGHLTRIYHDIKSLTIFRRRHGGDITKRPYDAVSKTPGSLPHKAPGRRQLTPEVQGFNFIQYTTATQNQKTE